MSALRAELKQWIERARDGEEVVVTDRGQPVARLSGIGTADLLQSLVRDGLLTPATVERPLVTPPERERSPRDRVSGLVRRIRR
ncbi:prevent-host-death family protein [Sediminihabitans luteus]|uniref:Antitoxin n=1 Tax=Sediminihabitans luteus TaxID=1138585 RepID=A0A2M9CEH3_9CELL|nr:prevent-host-death family protein [Sediminihabitans luteus]